MNQMQRSCKLSMKVKKTDKIRQTTIESKKVNYVKQNSSKEIQSLVDNRIGTD